MEKNVFNYIDTLIDETCKYANLLTPNRDYFVEAKEKEYSFQIALPGFDKENIKIEFEKDLLTISYEGEEDKWKKKFKRSFYTHNDINGDKISAKLDKGVLEIILPKKKDAYLKNIVID
jgi:HSP20 family protein